MQRLRQIGLLELSAEWKIQGLRAHPLATEQYTVREMLRLPVAPLLLQFQSDG